MKRSLDRLPANQQNTIGAITKTTRDAAHAVPLIWISKDWSIWAKKVP